MSTAEARREAEAKLADIEQQLLNGTGRATKEIARQLVVIAAEALAREKDLEIGAGQLDFTIRTKDELLGEQQTRHDALMTQLRKEHEQTIRGLAGV